MEGTFRTIEYVLLAGTLLLSLTIGLYYALFKKQNTAEEYFHGGKNMNFLAVSLSIISSILSGLTLISVPTEVYFFGIHYVLNGISAICVGFVSYLLVTPVFYKLELTSTYEYLEMRFDRKVKIFASFLYTIQILLYMPLVIYTPGLAVAQMTNINVHFITPAICIVCIVYTVFGGIKAVIWTDALQFLIMFGSVLTVLIIGVIKVGGLGNMFSTAYDTGRLNIDFDLNPTKRDTFWAVLFGTFGQLMALHVYNQGNIQKYLALSSYKNVKWTHIISMTGLVVFFLLSIFSGLLIVAAYVYCAPSTLEMKKPDQLVPYFVMDITATFPGLAGVFVAGVISAGLSTLSAGLNSLAATMYNDFLKNIFPKTILNKHEATILKVLVLFIGICCVTLVYVAEHLGNLLPLLFSAIGVTTGPMSALFTLGLFMPKIGSKAALSGSVISLIIMAWLITTAQLYKTKGWIKSPTLPVYTNNCISEGPILFRSPIVEEPDVEVFPLFEITHYYYTIMGTLMTILISWIINFFTKPDQKIVKDEYLSPLVHYFRRKTGKAKTSNYKSVEQALKIINDGSEYDNMNDNKIENNNAKANVN